MKAKGIDELLRAAKIIKKQFSNVQFHLVGFIEENYSQILSDYERRNNKIPWATG